MKVCLGLILNNKGNIINYFQMYLTDFVDNFEICLYNIITLDSTAAKTHSNYCSSLGR